MTLNTDSRLTRTGGTTRMTGTTGFARTRYSSTHGATALAVRGAKSWRRVREVLASAWRGVRATVTPAGWLLLIVAAAGLTTGIVFGLLEFVIAGAISLALLALSVPFLFSARSYDVDLSLGHDRVVAGTQVTGVLTVENIGRGATLPGRIDVPVGDGLVDVYIPLLRAGSVHRQDVVVPTHHRGIITIGPARTVRGDPLGILKREVSWAETHTLYVHPFTTTLRSSATGFIRDLEGSPSRTIVDADISFHALREYAPGDSPRQIHWKSTAKTGTLMVRQYEETMRSRMVIALALAAEEFADDDEFELAVSAAASIGIRGIRDGRDVDVVVSGEVPEFARHTVRTIRELTTVSTRTLLDDLSGVDRTTFVNPLGDVTSLAAETHPDASIGFLVCGSTVTARSLQAAAMSFPADVAVVAVVCDPQSEPRYRRLGAVSVMTIGLLDDLRHLLAKGSAS